MTSRLLYSFADLLFLVLLWTAMYFCCASSRVDSLESEATSKRVVKSSNPVSNNYISKIEEYPYDATIIPSSISSSNVSAEILDVNVQTFTQHTGYIPIKRSIGARLFYFFFESRGNKNDPVVLWLNGGPGGSSAFALFKGNGPFSINNDSSITWNDFGWDKVCNLLYVDHYIGTGFSYSSDHRDMRNNSKEASNDLYDFLLGFFEIHPNFLENDFYITGASYVGHIAPLLASQLHKKNKKKEGIHINLKGMAISNGNINPEYKYASYPDFVYANKLVSRSSYRLLKKYTKECLTSINLCQTKSNVCKDAKYMCNSFYHRLLNITGFRSSYNFRKIHIGPIRHDQPTIEKFFALDHVKTTLGVDNRTYVMYSKDVYDCMASDSFVNYAGVIPQLLEDGIKVLIFDGEYDLICNWLGNLRLMEAMKWNGRNRFLKTKLTSYKVNGKKVGEVKNVGPLTFLKVFNAGHGVVTYRPYESLQILNNWMNS